MELFGVGPMEAAVIVLITLLVVGPNRFPEYARQGARWYKMARRYADEVMGDVRGAMAELEDEVKTHTEDLRSVREIGDDFASHARSARSDLEAVGTSTRRDLEAPRALTRPEADDDDIEFIAPERPSSLEEHREARDLPLAPVRSPDPDR